MQPKSDAQLLREYAEHGAEPAFAEIVTRHTNLVYSAALRQVDSPDIAAEVAQRVFIELARGARLLTRRLAPEASLAGWLCRSARNISLNLRRDDYRRHSRERLAMEHLDPTSEIAPDWERLRPVLDEAMSELDEPDYDALVMRFFKNQDLRAVGVALGVSDDTAQKRVSRALEKLRERLSRRGITTPAAALSIVLSAHAVQAAPVGLAVTISTAAALAGTAVQTSTIIAATKTIAMTALQKAIITATIVAGVGVGIYEFREAATLRRKVQSLQQEQEQQTTLKDQIRELQRERDAATNRLAALAGENTTLKKNPSEVLRLRGEVGRLRQENASVAASSALNKITANPETRKVMRDQQKMGMTAIYKDLAKRLNLAPDQAEKFNDLLADHIMDNVDQITEALRDKKSDDQINQVFASQEAALQEKLKELIGPEGLAQYQEYTRNLCSTLTSEQFKGMLTGDDPAKQEKTKQLYQAMLEETQTALAGSGLPTDYQTVPMLNFRNIASEAQGEQSLKLLDGIYDRVAARANAFLSPEEQEKFKEFRAAALRNNRSALTMNRTLMAPLSK